MADPKCYSPDVYFVFGLRNPSDVSTLAAYSPIKVSRVAVSLASDKFFYHFVDPDKGRDQFHMDLEWHKPCMMFSLWLKAHRQAEDLHELLGLPNRSGQLKDSNRIIEKLGIFAEKFKVKDLAAAVVNHVARMVALEWRIELDLAFILDNTPPQSPFREVAVAARAYTVKISKDEDFLGSPNAAQYAAECNAFPVRIYGDAYVESGLQAADRENETGEADGEEVDDCNMHNWDKNFSCRRLSWMIMYGVPAELELG